MFYFHFHSGKTIFSFLFYFFNPGPCMHTWTVCMSCIICWNMLCQVKWIYSVFQVFNFLTDFFSVLLNILSYYILGEGFWKLRLKFFLFLLSCLWSFCFMYLEHSCQVHKLLGLLYRLHDMTLRINVPFYTC